MAGSAALWFTTASRRSPRVRHARRRLFYSCVRTLAFAVETGPRPLGTLGLRGLAQLAWWTRRGDRARALRQLALAFPDRSDAEHRRVGRRSLQRLADNLVGAVRADEPISIRPEDDARLRALLAGPRPVLFLTAHLGCWEALGRFLAGRAGGLGVVTANPHNRAVYDWLRRRRERAGLTVFDRDAPLGAVRWLARGRPLAVLADVRTRGATIAAPWFGRPAPTVTSPARWARRFGAVVVPVGIRRDGHGHRVWVEPVVDVVTGSEREAVARCNRALTDMIRRAPEEWIWIHDRYGDGEGATR